MDDKILNQIIIDAINNLTPVGDKTDVQRVKDLKKLIVILESVILKMVTINQSTLDTKQVKEMKKYIRVFTNDFKVNL